MADSPGSEPSQDRRPSAVGFAVTSVDEVRRVASFPEVARELGGAPVFSARRPPPGDPPSLFMTSSLAALAQALASDSPPMRSALFAGWPAMQGSGIRVADARPSPDDPMMGMADPLTTDGIADALLGSSPVSRVQPSDLAGAMFEDVDGSVTQVLLRLLASAESSAAKARVKSVYVRWTLGGGDLGSGMDALADAGAAADAVSSAADWLGSARGESARLACGEVGDALRLGLDVDCAAIADGTAASPFDLRYMAAASPSTKVVKWQGPTTRFDPGGNDMATKKAADKDAIRARMSRRRKARAEAKETAKPVKARTPVKAKSKAAAAKTRTKAAAGKTKATAKATSKAAAGKAKASAAADGKRTHIATHISETLKSAAAEVAKSRDLSNSAYIRELIQANVTAFAKRQAKSGKNLSKAMKAATS